MRKTLTLTSVVVLAFLSVAAIKFFTDYPNSVPVGSDFFVLQRNQSYINASVSQVKGDWFTSPVFTGNGSIGGNWTANFLFGDGFNITDLNLTYATNNDVLSSNLLYQSMITISNQLYQSTVVGGAFIANFNGNGTNTTNWGVSTFEEIDAQNFFPTNTFLSITNTVLATDSNGQPTGIANAHGVLTNTATGPASFGLLQAAEIAAGISPFFNGINFTNEGYSLPTNNVGGGAFVFGGPGTAATLYDTNITAATTLKLFDISACGATAGGFKLYVTCSGGTDRILTFPNGCSGAGLGTPPAVTITNAKAAFFDVIYKPGATPVTNVFWSPVY